MQQRAVNRLEYIDDEQKAQVLGLVNGDIDPYDYEGVRQLGIRHYPYRAAICPPLPPLEEE